MIIDPSNDNNAIDQDGELVHAFRFIKHVADPSAPTLAELTDPDNSTIVGYGKMPDFSVYEDSAGRTRLDEPAIRIEGDDA